jgi:hypothetical protein
LKFWAAAGVIIGPVLAMFISHVFSAFLARQAELHERPRRREQMKNHPDRVAFPPAGRQPLRSWSP